MGNHIKTKLLATSFILLVSINPLQAQQESPAHHLDPGDFALGLRSTWSYFDHDGSGTGVGGQFRLALAPRLNTSWYADYILIPLSDSRQSEYIHIGWSVMYYLLNPENKIHSVQPYVVAGHCFDYNKKTSFQDDGATADRWGSAVQSGLGAQFVLSSRVDLSFETQYMLHLTKELSWQEHDGSVHVHEHSGSSIEGHLLTTLSVNVKLVDLW